MAKRKPTPVTPAADEPKGEPTPAELAATANPAPEEPNVPAPSDETAAEVASGDTTELGTQTEPNAVAEPAEQADPDTEVSGHVLAEQLTEAQPTIPDEPTAADPDAMVEARILLDHRGYRANTFALLSTAEAANCAGWADTNPVAVAYAKSLAE